MSTDKGFIKLYRDVRDHWIWKEDPFSMGQAWIDLLMMVNHEDKKVLFNGNLVTVKRGSCITSLRKLSERWKRNKRTVSRYLDLFEADGMITQKRDSKCTTINIVNYCIYQASNDNKRTPSAPPSAPLTAPQSAPLSAHKQETRRSKEETKEEVGFVPEDEPGEPWEDDMWDGGDDDDETDL